MTKTDAEPLLKRMLGPDATFRDGQWEAVDRAANQGQRLLVVQRTGWGKSVVYFLATKILRDRRAGPALLVSPLLALMRNQILAAERLGLRPATIHSENVEEWRTVENALRQNTCDILLISPERLGNAEFLKNLLPQLQGQIGLFVVDEAHCISDWGHDFRPDYRRIVRILRYLPPGVPVLCTTATANNRVVTDVLQQIPRLQTLRGPLIRPSLRLFNIKLADQADRLAWLAHFLPKLPGSGIIYCLTIDDTRRVAQWLLKHGIAARAYHADLEATERVEAEQLLLQNGLKALVATVALGMGFDKPDLGFVIHFQRPGSVVAYYQQVGRAGRAVGLAYGILLSGREDDEITDYFIRTAFPPSQVMEEVLHLLERHSSLTLEAIGAELNFSRGCIEKALKLLEVDGAVERRKTEYARTVNSWTVDVARAEQVTQLRRAELEEIRRYVDHPGCLMEFLARALDDPSPVACGKCMNCADRKSRRTPPPELVQEAVQFLRGDTLVLSPRTRWPKLLLPSLQKLLPAALELFEDSSPKTTIPAALRSEKGRALCIYGDAGWGKEVAAGKYQTGVFSQALVDASAHLIQSAWKPVPAPVWIVAVPSERHPALVEGFARQLAAYLGLHYGTPLRKTRALRPQKEMQNSVLQLRNVMEAFVTEGNLPSWPILLVDDVVDSGWTLTWLTVLLRQAGSGPVYPFALAKAAPRGN